MTAADQHVGHGYTLADVDRHARIGLSMTATSAGSSDDRYQAAWDAVVMALVEAEQPPSRRDLSVAASNAVEKQWHNYRHHHGINSRGAVAPRHCMYWLDLGRPTSSPEPAIVEREALARIWPALNDRDRAALTALATMGTYAAAAVAMGLDYRTFTERVRRARTRYLALWHEGETPSRLWRVDRRERTTDRWASKNRSDLLRRGAAISRREGRPHGTWTRYCSGCRCAECKAEARRVNAAAYARRRAAAAGDAA